MTFLTAVPLNPDSGCTPPSGPEMVANPMLPFCAKPPTSPARSTAVPYAETKPDGAERRMAVDQLGLERLPRFLHSTPKLCPEASRTKPVTSPAASIAYADPKASVWVEGGLSANRAAVEPAMRPA